MVFGKFTDFIAASIELNLLAFVSYNYLRVKEGERLSIDKLFLDPEPGTIEKKRTVNSLILLNGLNASDYLTGVETQYRKEYEDEKERQLTKLPLPKVCLFFIFQALVMLGIDGFDSDYSDILTVSWCVISLIGFIWIWIKSQRCSYPFVIGITSLLLVVALVISLLNYNFVKPHNSIIPYFDVWGVAILSVIPFLGLAIYGLLLWNRRLNLKCITKRFDRKYQREIDDIMQANRTFDKIAESKSKFEQSAAQYNP